MVSDCCGTLTALFVLSIVSLIVYFFKKAQGNACARSENRSKIKRNEAKRSEYLKELETRLDGAAADVSALRQQILALNFFSLKDALQSGKHTAAQVMDAYLWKSVKVTKELNCITEYLREAEEEAARLDDEFKGKTKPPLFGLPFSVKDNFWVKGYDCTRGLGSQLEQPAPETSTFVAHLQSLGAIPFCRTNVPQTLLHYATTNPVWGTTNHPLNHERNPGGSSGGECALLAGGGSAFGIGSDLGGSLRIPASFCGLVSLKITSDRFQMRNCHEGIPGVPKLGLSNGFFTRSVAEQEFLLSTFLTTAYQSQFHRTAPLPFGSVSFDKKKKLRIGYVKDDGFLQPVPAMQRVVDLAADKLRARGHELVPFTIPRPREAMATTVRNLNSDNGGFLLSNLDHNDPDPLLSPSYKLLSVPLWLRSLLARIVRERFPSLAAVAGAYNSSVDDVPKAGALADEYRAEFEAAWSKAGLDVLLSHAFPFPAPRHDAPAKLAAAAFITIIFNLLDYPAGVVKVGEWGKEDEEALISAYPSPDAVPPSILHHPLEKNVLDAVKGSEGLPLAVQLVTPRFQDELCLHAMTELEAAL